MMATGAAYPGSREGRRAAAGSGPGRPEDTRGAHVASARNHSRTFETPGGTAVAKRKKPTAVATANLLLIVAPAVNRTQDVVVCSPHHSRGDVMHDELSELLKRARMVLERYMFDADGETIRDDVAEVCMAIDDALPDAARVQVKKIELERSAA